jgi:hypothetical protein
LGDGKAFTWKLYNVSYEIPPKSKWRFLSGNYTVPYFVSRKKYFSIGDYVHGYLWPC